MSTVYNDSILIGFLADDHGSGIAYTAYHKDEGEWHEYQAPLHILEEGTHIVEYYSVDKAGNIEATQKFSFKIDRSPPQVKILYPNGGEITEGTINIRWLATDLTNVSINIYCSNDGGSRWHLIVENEDNDGEYMWNTSNVPDGMNYLVRIVAEDEAGNINEDTSDTPFVIYNNHIEVNVTHPRIGYLYINNREILPLPFNITVVIGKITLAAEVKCGLPIQKVEFYVDEELKFSDEDAPYEWVWDETTCYAHTIKIVAYDVLGNRNVKEIELWAFNL